MSMEYIRLTYGVPAKRGAAVRVDWYPPELARNGTITGSDGARLRIRLDGESVSRIAHPTWRVTYLAPHGLADRAPTCEDVFVLVNEEEEAMNKAEREHLNMVTGKGHDLIVTMQAALIEWKHGRGAEAALQWIVNTLCGPGLLPSVDEPYGKEAQAYMSSNRSDPMPTCACGRPSHIGWMGQGFCSEAHYAKAKIASLN